MITSFSIINEEQTSELLVNVDKIQWAMFDEGKVYFSIEMDEAYEFAGTMTEFKEILMACGKYVQVKEL